MAVAIILLLIAVASVLFHLLSPWWWTPLASNWGYIDDTISNFASQGPSPAGREKSRGLPF